MSITDATVYVADAGPSMRSMLARLLRPRGFTIESWSTIQEFPAQRPGRSPSCLVLDLETPRIDGLGLQQRLSESGRACPIVFLSGRGDISLAVRAMKGGAVDFLTKPVNESDLLEAVGRALRESERALKDDGSRRRVASLLHRLSPREREVYRRVVLGRLNKQIARDLGITEQTVKVHRARVMQKTRASSLAALVRLSQRGEPAHSAANGRAG